LAAEVAEECGVYNVAPLMAIRLLTLTGCRRNEVLELRWEYLDAERSVLRLPDSKTGQKIVPLGAAAVELLATLPRDPSGWIFPGEVPGEHYKNIARVWEAVRKRAELRDVRLHDLRHSFASVGASTGDSLLILGKVLGHKHAVTTGRYAHLAPDPVRATADRIAGSIAAAMSPGPKASTADRTAGHVATALGVGAKLATLPVLASSVTTPEPVAPSSSSATPEPVAPSSVPVLARAGAPMRAARSSSVPRARRGGA
jgi:hypothetical protein